MRPSVPVRLLAYVFVCVYHGVCAAVHRFAIDARECSASACGIVKVAMPEERR